MIWMECVIRPLDLFQSGPVSDNWYRLVNILILSKTELLPAVLSLSF